VWATSEFQSSLEEASEIDPSTKWERGGPRVTQWSSRGRVEAIETKLLLILCATSSENSAMLSGDAGMLTFVPAVVVTTIPPGRIRKMERSGKPRHRWANPKGQGAGAKESIVRVRSSYSGAELKRH
jgi:hypothetical protein